MKRPDNVSDEKREADTGSAEAEKKLPTSAEEVQKVPAGSEGELKLPKLCCSARALLTVMCFVAMFNISYVRVGISIALICMTQRLPPELGMPNVAVTEAGEFQWSATTQGYLTSAVFYGFILGPSVGGFLSFKFGGKLVLVVGTIGIGVGNLFAPEAAKLMPYLFFAVRLLTGFFAGFVFPAFYDLVSHWVVPEERQLLVTGALTSIPFASISNFPVSGFLCKCCGWIWLFYAFSIWSILCGIVFQFTVFNYPDQCPYINQKEALYLNTRIPRPVKQKIPWKFILKSLPIYAYITMHFCMNYVYLTIIFSLPLLLSRVHKISLQENSLLSATPFVGSFVMRILLSLFFEHLRLKLKLSKNALRKIFVGLGAVLVSTFLLLVTFLTNRQRYWVVACFIMASSCLEFCLTGGYLTSLLDLCPTYANILTGISNTIGNVAGLICPVVHGFITKHGTKEEYDIAYYITISILLVSATFYLVFGQNTLQEWSPITLPNQMPVHRASLVT